VSAALPKALRALGHGVTVILPRFPSLEAQGLLLARRLTPLKAAVGARAFEATLFDGRLASQVDLVAVEVAGLFDRAGVYGERGEDYPDNALRFAVFSSVVAQLVRERVAGGRPVDAVHCNDWPTALVPAYLRAAGAPGVEAPLSTPRTVLTIHNAAYQGAFSADQLSASGLDAGALGAAPSGAAGGVNFLERGIATADVVATVSPGYAREIQTPGHGGGLDAALRARGGSLVGITNGVDYSVWNPATDAALASRYDAEDLTNRARCKGALQKELGLSIDAQAPIVASVGRMVEQKGTDLVAAMMPKLLRASEAQIIIAGDGDAALVSAIEGAVAKSNGRAAFARAASEDLIHRIFAGADVVLVPSRDEPCGLVQMYAQRYGALPVARATGGLLDTIVDCDAKLE
ncbi:MAG: glycogen synthase, partial [Polyangiaceae bacterium]